MDVRYITQPGDQLDLICKRHYGGTVGTVEAVLSANPDIADSAHRLPTSTQITLPELGPANAAAVRPKLWG